MLETDKKISQIIQYQLPDFVRGENDMYVAFIKSYFQYLEQEGNVLHFMERFQRNLDVDRADDDFIQNYLDEFATVFPAKLSKIPTSHLLKLMREFYLSKGSEGSFRFAFTVLYGVDIEILYPRDQLYIPSSGNWNADIILNISGDNWFKLDLTGEYSASIVGQTSGSTAVIDTITTLFIEGQRILRLEISSYDDDFIPGEDVVLTVDDRNHNEVCYGSIKTIQIDDGGTNYEIDDEVTITGALNGRRAKAKILNLEKGGFGQVTIDSAGTDYEVGDVITAEAVIKSNGYGFRAHVYEVGGSGEILKVRVDSPGYDYSIPVTGVIGSVNGTGAALSLNGDSIGKIKTLEVFDGGLRYGDPNDVTISITSENGVGFSATPIIGGIFTEPKRYFNEKSTLSGTSKILDSYYYQQFSYVIASRISPHKWLGTIKRILHPAGTQLFGMYKLDNDFNLDVNLAPDAGRSYTISLPQFAEADLSQQFTDSQEYIRVYELDGGCYLGLNIRDLDDMKFMDTFDYTIGDFSDESISSVYGGCADLINKQESSTIVIT